MADGTTTKSKKWLWIGGGILLVVIIGVTIYYFKVIRPKKRIEKAITIFSQLVEERSKNPDAGSELVSQLVAMNFFPAFSGANDELMVLIDGNTGEHFAEAKIK